MRQLKRFNFELHLARRVAEISSQVAELRRLRELVRLAKRRQGVASAEGANLQFENRRAVRIRPMKAALPNEACC